jgi:tRNA(Ile)-lysidine synthase
LRRFARNDDVSDRLDRLAPDGDLGLAVSGGPDSLALLLLAARARPGRVRAATVDHGLRPESVGEAAIVAARCAELGVPHDILSVAVEPGASLQAQAREARYAALGEWAGRQGLAAVATAHHADDQAETLLMRLARGSGVGGLAGIREERALAPGVRLIRPLLGLRKADLVAVVEGAGWRGVDDPSNHDPRHDRTQARALLGGTPWLEPERLARSAAALADAAEALDAMTAREWAEEVRREGEVFAYRPSPLREVRRRIAAQAIGELNRQASVRGPDLDRLVGALDGGRGGTLAGVMVRAEGDEWLFRLAPPRRT